MAWDDSVQAIESPTVGTEATPVHAALQLLISAEYNTAMAPLSRATNFKF